MSQSTRILSHLIGVSLLPTLTLLAGCSQNPETASAIPTSADVTATKGSALQVNASWMSAIESGLQTSAYQPKTNSLGIQANNPAQGFEAQFDAEGAMVMGADWELGIAVENWGSHGAMQAAAPALLKTSQCVENTAFDSDGNCLKRVEQERPGITEWWENRAEGLHHGFSVASAPGEGDLVVSLAITGASVEVVDDNAAIFTTDNGLELRYEGLAAWDATGKSLPAQMVETDAGLALQVDTAGAVWPVTIDPTLSTQESNQASAYFGYSVANAGDVNNDGYDDAIIGAYLYDNGQTNEGRAYVYLGSATGLAATAAWTAESNQTNAYFGFSVSGAGDVNNDGYGDVIVGSYLYDNGQTDEGRAFVYLGSATGLATTAAWTAEADLATSWFGYDVAGAGDVNNDGYDDVIVGSPYYANGQATEGRSFVYLGSATGLATTASWTYESNQIDARLGWSVSGAGDVNGDGYGDVIVGGLYYDNGQTNEGRAWAIYGSATGLAATAAWTAESNQASAVFGSSVSGAGDVNGDGYDDVIVGSYLYDNGQTNEGRVYVYHGSATGLSTSAAWTAESNQASASSGFAVANAGDINGDGYDDVMVGSYLYDNGQTDEGAVWIYQGSATGLSATAAWQGESDQASANYGIAVAGGGDFDGNGYADWIVGAWKYDNGQTDEGRTYAYRADIPDADGDGDPTNTDCDDSNAAINHSATEVCDGVDNNCNGSIDEVGTLKYVDADGDGFGLTTSSVVTCSSVGYASVGGDCDDTNSTVNPTASELDDLLDNDCDGLVDETFVAAGDIVITEINRQPRNGATTTYNAGMWFEVYNKSARTVDLSNWYVTRTSSVGTDLFYVDPASTVVAAPGQYLVFCATNDMEASATALFPLTCDYYWKDETQVSTYTSTYKDNTFNLQRDTDDLRILVGGASGTLIDNVHWYYDATNGYWSRDARYSLSLDPLHYTSTDNDSRSYWCSTASSSTGTVANNTAWRWFDVAATNNDEHGTPGIANYDCPAIP